MSDAYTRSSFLARGSIHQPPWPWPDAPAAREVALNAVAGLVGTAGPLPLQPLTVSVPTRTNNDAARCKSISRTSKDIAPLVSRRTLGKAPAKSPNETPASGAAERSTDKWGD